VPKQKPAKEVSLFFVDFNFPTRSNAWFDGFFCSKMQCLSFEKNCREPIVFIQGINFSHIVIAAVNLVYNGVQSSISFFQIQIRVYLVELLLV
jgi:hypothetical protein